MIYGMGMKDKTAAILERFYAGNDKAFAELYNTYVDMLYNYGCCLTSDHELVKDCIHDVFVKVYSKRNEANKITNFASYVFMSLKNRLLDEFRKRTFVTDVQISDCESQFQLQDVEKQYISDEAKRMRTAKVDYLLNCLTTRQRQAFILYYIEERKYDDICQIMNMNYNSVRNLVHRGMLKLREAVGQ